MVTVNHNYLKLPGSYLFSTIGKKVRAYKEENPDKEVISLGIGDVTQPLSFTFFLIFLCNCPVFSESLHFFNNAAGLERV